MKRSAEQPLSTVATAITAASSGTVGSAARSSPSADLEDCVVEVLNLEIRPLLLIHGGGIDLLAIDEDGRVELEFQGACRGCALQSVTYAIGVRQRLMEIPGVREVDVRGVRLSKMALQRTAEMYRGYTFRPGGTVRST